MSSFNKNVAKLFTILRKRVFPNLNPTSYLKDKKLTTSRCVIGIYRYFFQRVVTIDFITIPRSINYVLIKQNCLQKTFLRTKILITQVSLSLRITKASGPDCITMVVLQKCESELCYIPAEFFNMCSEEILFPNCWKGSSVFPV